MFHRAALRLLIGAASSLLLLPSVVLAQGIPVNMGPGATGAPTSTREGSAIHVKVFDEDHKPLKEQALVRVVNVETGMVLFKSTTESKADFPELHIGKYLIEVGAAGYLPGHASMTIPDVNLDLNESFTFVRDPSAVDLRIHDSGSLPGKTRKELEKGIQALELGDFMEARKRLESAYHSKQDSPSANFLLGYLAQQQKEPDRELRFLQAAIKLDPNHVQANSLLGGFYYRKDDCEHAIPPEEVVVAHAPEAAAARKVLASCYLRTRQFSKSADQAAWLVEKGGSEAISAKLILGQALAGTGKYADAARTLREYLEAAPTSAVAPQVSALVQKLEAGGQSASGADLNIGAKSEEDSASSSAGMPQDIDQNMPAISNGVQCPVDWQANTSARATELVSNVAQFSAIEDMTHESLSNNGTPRSHDLRKFNYLVSITEPMKGSLVVQEYRNAGVLDMPEQISSTGLAVLAIAFHPSLSDGFEMKCEGLGQWAGQPAWLVHFRQRVDKPVKLRSYVVNGGYFPIALKGRAWFAADNFQILHLETDLVKSVPEIHLFTEHTSVSYGPVQFKKSKIDLWLPKNADMYVHFAKHRFHRSESFDHFMLFATDAIDKPKLPSAPNGGNSNTASEHSGGPNQN